MLLPEDQLVNLTMLVTVEDFVVPKPFSSLHPQTCCFAYSWFLERHARIINPDHVEQDKKRFRKVIGHAINGIHENTKHFLYEAKLL